MRADVYKNLHRACYSVRVKGKVASYASSVVLADVNFHVSQSGNARVRARKCREVHAWVKGEVELATDEPVSVPPSAKRFTYNPFRDTGFVLSCDLATPVKAAARVWLTPEGAFAELTSGLE
jgi:hypothetical protein